MEHLVLRRMLPDEAATVAGVWRRSRQHAQPWLEGRVARSEADDLRRIEHVAATGQVWVAIDEGVLIGLLGLVGQQLDLLYVEPSAQGRGVGTTLLEHARVVSPSGLTLFTHQRNVRARAFYEHRGFRATRLGTSPAPESEPDVLYEWTPERMQKPGPSRPIVAPPDGPAARLRGRPVAPELKVDLPRAFQLRSTPPIPGARS